MRRVHATTFHRAIDHLTLKVGVPRPGITEYRLRSDRLVGLSVQTDSRPVFYLTDAPYTPDWPPGRPPRADPG